MTVTVIVDPITNLVGGRHRAFADTELPIDTGCGARSTNTDSVSGNFTAGDRLALLAETHQTFIDLPITVVIFKVTDLILGLDSPDAFALTLAINARLCAAGALTAHGGHLRAAADRSCTFID